MDNRNGNEGVTWYGPHVRIGRLRFNFRVMKHVYAVGADRWSVQASAYYDRKAKNRPKFPHGVH